MASGSTLVGATLESVGYHYQAYFLDVFAGPFQSSIGELFMVVGGIMALASFALTGRYKFAAWFLLGPAMFFGVVLNRTEVPPAEWRFAGRHVVENATRNRVCESIENQGWFSARYGGASCSDLTVTPMAEVSSVFAWFNELVSNTIQQVSYIIVQEKHRANNQVFARAELVTAATSERVRNPGLRALIHSSLIGQCNDVMSKAQIADGTDNINAVKTIARAEMQELLQNKQVQLKGEELYYVARLALDYANDINDPRNGGLFADMLQIANGTSVPADAYALLGQIHGFTANSQNWTPAETRTNLSKFIQDSANARYTCLEVWALTYMGLYETGKQIIDRYQLKAEDLFIHEQAILCDFKKLLAIDQADATDNNCNYTHPDIPSTAPTNPDRPYLLYGAIAKFILRNEMIQPTPASTLFSRLSKRTSEFAKIQSPHTIDPAQAERQDQEVMEWQYRAKVHKLASSMPYYQGLTLFFLGVTFPFFALMLLIPGKHPVFIRWFQLWLWVKCWDVGFAVVMMLDQVLFNLVSVAQFPDIGDPGPELSPDLGVVLFSLRELDPSFNLGTYYHIVSTCLAAIPPVLSQLILGVFGGGGGLIAGGMSNAADYFAQGHEVGRGHGPVTQNRLAGYEEAARAGHGQIAQAVSNVTGKANQATGAAPGTVGGMAQQFGGEGDPNFVADPTGKSTGTGYQINNSSLKAPFMARGRSAGELMNYALHSAGVEGVADGAGNVASSLTMVPFVSGAMSSMQKIPVAGDVFLNPFKAVQPGAQTARKYFMEAVKAQLDYLNNKAWWDTFNSNEVQDLASRARIYRMLEIPWVAFDGPWGDAYKIEIMQSVDFWVKGFGVASNVLGGVDGGSEKKGLMGDAAQRLGATIGAGALLYFLHQKDRAEVLPSQDDTFYQKVDSFDASSSPALAQTGNSTQEEQATLRQNLRTALATLDTNNLAYGELYPLLQKEHITQDDIDRVRYAARASKRKDEDVSVLDSAD